MGNWTPATEPGFYGCRRHPDVAPFASGRVCAKCVIDPGEEEQLEHLSEAPDGEGLPKMEDHESWFLEMSETFAAAARAFLPAVTTSAKGRKSKTKGQPLTAAKLADVALKARRAAIENTRWREDWGRTEKLEAELRGLREMHH